MNTISRFPTFTRALGMVAGTLLVAGAAGDHPRAAGWARTAGIWLDRTETPGTAGPRVRSWMACSWLSVPRVRS